MDTQDPASVTTSSASSTTTTTIATTIKLLHKDSSLERFSGEDSNHSPLVFFQICEDTMVNSNIIQDLYKTFFVRSQLVTDSLASLMMRATCFDIKIIGSSYAAFSYF